MPLVDCEMGLVILNGSIDVAQPQKSLGGIEMDIIFQEKIDFPKIRGT